MRLITGVILALMLVASADAKIVTRTIEYNHGAVMLEGYLAYDDALKGPLPGVMIVHQWKGLGEYEKMRAEMLAEMGYVAFAVDMYGKGIRPQTSEEAGKQASIYRGDRDLMRARVTAGLSELQRQPNVDKKRIAAIGYCFGGGVVLELARSGADIAGVVSFHGNLDTPDPNDAKNIKAKVLVCHGADDPYTSKDQVINFWNEMAAADVDWQLIAYGGAVHSFTDKFAGTDKSAGAAYNERADRRSWQDMQQFFAEILGK